MQDEITEAIVALKKALAEISMEAGKAQKRELQGRRKPKDTELMGWVEIMEHAGSKILGDLEVLESEAGSYDNWKEGK